ncbi:conserved hypothetical protein [Paecilomyces variotii No. 5]|uniref:Xylanolytic transcriptional activator regulatory domain-containing protein n=1 Tax=Byssochlamys spectabilis (strain No. 5 / NBRC 109023) TaxID=1356009 RepID=V5I3X0_BYSSN|nr:conserved hypothetical protein [Paecilomyces variotii No. 5]
MEQHPNTPSRDIIESEPSTVDTTSDASDLAHSPGKTVIDGVHSIYKGADSWYDVLQEINELRQVCSENQDDWPLALSTTVDGSSLLFSQVQRVDKMELLLTLPPKPEVDKLIHYFFDRENFPIPIVPILHEPTFMHEYNEHWKDPSKANVIWLGLLFSILSIDMLAYQQFGEPSEYEGKSESLFQLYRLRTAQCLIIGDISKCRPYTIETLRFNATAELNRKDDNSRSLWIMIGVIVRAAINMGYHRDPSQSSYISTLQAEYRRRVWMSVVELDDMASFMTGFPRMAASTYADTMEPRNLYDWELSDDTAVLPPSRPMSEITPITFLIAKAHLFQALGRITDFNNRPSPSPYEEILGIDNMLYEAYENLPGDLKMDSMKSHATESDKRTSASAVQLCLMYHQGMCQLHRRFIARGRLDSRYNHSRDRCISSALAILELQNYIDPLWYRFSRAVQVFTLAAMILFLELEHRRRHPETDVSSNSGALLQALKTSCALWEAAKNHSDDAKKKYQILADMLSSFQTPVSWSSPSQPGSSEPICEFPGSVQSLFQPSKDPLFDGKDLLTFSNGMNIDWAAWDAFIEGAIFED